MLMPFPDKELMLPSTCSLFFQLTLVCAFGPGGSVLVMSPPVWCSQILTVDPTLVDLERSHCLRYWIGNGDRSYACIHHVLAGGTLKLR